MDDTIKLPNQVIDSDWKDDIVDYEAYDNEKTYVSPKSIKKETLAKIKSSPIKLAIRNMVDWGEITNKVSA
ncbi:hypothetical protein IKF32_01205 [Candidatus Saccharibacteria bacterium]|nr:hypothetical protein [Candidatus Saccharibacteria bacterium]